MRPGQLTPENVAYFFTIDFIRFPCFNEAGAINPGKPGATATWMFMAFAASMRPGQLTPENNVDTIQCRHTLTKLQ